MWTSDQTADRPRTRRLLAALLFLFGIACDESKLLLPPLSDPANLEPTRVEFIFLADADGTVRERLTEGSWPSWSPDGRRILFHRDGLIRVIGADGTGETDLAVGQWPTWSPDGSRIAYASRDGISVMNTDGSEARPLLSPALVALHDWGVGKPSWSPDGALIAFDEPAAYADGFNARIFAMTADGTSQYFLAGYGQYETEPSWSPDGSRVVYWSISHGLAIVDRDGGQPLPLAKDPSVSFHVRPAWSPDGRAILFNRVSPTAIMSISPDGGSARVLIEGGADAAWSPDGERIAFVRLEPR